ncbi:MAG: hypothetical protein HRT37_01770 [Alteromonadaceae bacterium]|nr:hypothetical protein [Alteromonadaceae bacterium]
MNLLSKLMCVGYTVCSFSIIASELIEKGHIKEISYRAGYITLKIIADDGTNFCEACPADPGGRSDNKCWIEETKEAQISMLLSAQARGKKVYGRVMNFSTNCNIYQMSIDD